MDTSSGNGGAGRSCSEDEAEVVGGVAALEEGPIGDDCPLLAW